MRLTRQTPPEERMRILETLFRESRDRGWHRFGAMMVLSVVIAVMGLSLNSAAVVIGAMLIAPLMTPVIGFAAALAMGWPRRLAASGAAIALATLGGIGLSWLLARLLPSVSLTEEVLSRTAPDVRDLAVALAAGAAGAYATARENVSSALPGVAVAVALIPPLAAIGYTLELGRGDLAEGALLLYLANLVAIVLASMVVLLLAGFVPDRLLTTRRSKLAGSVGAVVLATAVISVPLTVRSLDVAERARLTRTVDARVSDWLGRDTSLEVTVVDINGSLVAVHLTGPEEPPPARELAASLVPDLGEDARVEVRWTQQSHGAGDPDEQPPPAPEEDGEELLLAELRPLVEQWLAAAAGEDGADELIALVLGDAGVTIQVRGPVPPPPVATLADAIETETGSRLEVTALWTEQRAYDSAAPATPDERLLARQSADAWVRLFPGLGVVAVTVEGDAVVVDLAGEQPPVDIRGLVDAVVQAIGRDVEVTVRFVERRILPLEPPATETGLP